MSISRLMVEIVDEKHQRLAAKMRNLLGLYRKNADLISIGAYQKGTNTQLDEAVEKYPKINRFLMQQIKESFSYEDTVRAMEEALA